LHNAGDAQEQDVPVERPRGDYGYDAPAVPVIFLLVAVAAAGLGSWATLTHRGSLMAVGFGNAAWFGLSAASYLYTTRRGKLAVWGELLDGAGLRGDEKLLDVGCGRGAVLLLAARRLPMGRVTGIDLWSTTDQSGNAEATTRANAAAEGVSERVELVTGDMRKLPFPDGAFDVVVSSLAIHNVPDAAGRKAAVEEIARVLRKGGLALLADYRNTADYQRVLRETLATTVERRNLGWRFWYGGPHAATRLVTFRKPGASDPR
jgi:SAM-dependent methyltransferase